ncbi:MAG: hypothetical protein PWQ57_924 [Desulfovibrionales bacterium]|nr:hypothetical protein [Desulfovibrionales bacterium]
MTAEEYRSELRLLGMSQIGLTRVIRHLADSSPSAVTANRWATGETPVPATVAALLRVIGRLPKRTLDELRRIAKDNSLPHQ